MAQRCSFIMKLREYSSVFAVGRLHNHHNQNELKTLTVGHTADLGFDSAPLSPALLHISGEPGAETPACCP